MGQNLDHLNSGEFAKTTPKNEKLAATTWAKDSLDAFNEKQIIDNLKAIEKIPAKDWYNKYAKGTTDTYISAVQGALKLLYDRNPKVYKNPGAIDGIYSNVRDGKPDLSHSRTAAAMEVVTGKRAIDENSVTFLIRAIEANNTAQDLQDQIEKTGKPDAALRTLRGDIVSSYTHKDGLKTPIESFGQKHDIITLPNGNFKLFTDLDIEFTTLPDAMTTLNFINSMVKQFKGKGATKTPFNIQWGTGDIEFDTAESSSDWKHLGGLLDTEVIDDASKKLPKSVLSNKANKKALVYYLNLLPGWKA